VLIPWIPFFDPYNTVISRVDQWIRIPRLPWKLWDIAYLTDLLKHVGHIIKLDQNTLLRLKGKFVRVYSNLDITKPLRGSLSIFRMESYLRVPIICEGLHEVCPLYVGESHQLETCPNLPRTSKIEVFVEKFDTFSLTKAQSPSSSSRSPPIPIETWVTVSPKIRVKAMIHAIPKRNSSLNPHLKEKYQ